MSRPPVPSGGAKHNAADRKLEWKAGRGDQSWRAARKLLPDLWFLPQRQCVVDREEFYWPRTGEDQHNVSESLHSESWLWFRRWDRRIHHAVDGGLSRRSSALWRRRCAGNCLKYSCKSASFLKKRWAPTQWKTGAKLWQVNHPFWNIYFDSSRNLSHIYTVSQWYATLLNNIQKWEANNLMTESHFMQTFYRDTIGAKQEIYSSNIFYDLL